MQNLEIRETWVTIAKMFKKADYMVYDLKELLF